LNTWQGTCDTNTVDWPAWTHVCSNQSTCTYLNDSGQIGNKVDFLAQHLVDDVLALDVCTYKHTIR
jgi:hypothetical protein